MARTDGRRPHHLIVLVARTDIDPSLHALIREHLGRPQAEIWIVAPALAPSGLEHLAGDIDDSIVEARAELASSFAEIRGDEDWTVHGDVGDADPLLAIEDAMRQFPADEILVVTREAGDEVWAEKNLFEEIDRRFGVPAVHVVADGNSPEITERASAPREDDEETEVDARTYQSLPPMSARDLAAIAVSILGTIILLISIATASGALESATGKLRALLAVYCGLLAVYNVFRLILNEAVRFRRLPIQMLSWLSLVGVPIAVIVGLVV